MRTFLALILALVAFLAMAVPSNAESTIQAEVARTGVWANTKANTPAVWGSGSQPCWSKVGVRSLNNSGGVTPNIYDRMARVPVPCNFAPSPGTDGEAVIQDQTGAAAYSYTEFWTTKANGYIAGIPQWTIGWGGAANTSEMTSTEGLRVWPGWMGTQASGIAFLPGVPRVSELQAGKIDHPVQLMVPEACTYHKAPATRHDSSAGGANCIPEGQKYKLPADVSCASLRRVSKAICEAAKNYFLIVTDQTHDKVTFRLEGIKPGQTSPYSRTDGGLFGCDGLFNGQPAASGSEYDCYPNEQAEFRGFPWASLIPVN